jgi:integrative and conjugative element protein (TIGR02256 family)
MTDVQFWSADNRFGTKIGVENVGEILRYCQESSPQETGGILLGRYSAAHDCALIEKVTGAPVDSQMGRTWFVRGVRGLQAKLDLLWHRNEGYYLGEWHFHPFGSPIPSSVDVKQLQKIARSRLYRCPEPMLMILGGDPANSWTMRAFLFRRRSKTHVELSYLSNAMGRLTFGPIDASPIFGSDYPDAFDLSTPT